MCITGYNYRGDISIDDVTFKDCAPPIPTDKTSSCKGNSQYMCTNGYCLNDTQLCDMQADCMDGLDESVSPTTGLSLLG